MLGPTSRKDPTPVWVGGARSALESLPRCDPGMKGAREGSFLAVTSVWCRGPSDASSRSGRPASWGQSSEALGRRPGGTSHKAAKRTRKAHGTDTGESKLIAGVGAGGGLPLRRTPEPVPSHPTEGRCSPARFPQPPQTVPPGGPPALAARLCSCEPRIPGQLAQSLCLISNR